MLIEASATTVVQIINNRGLTHTLGIEKGEILFTTVPDSEIFWYPLFFPGITASWLIFA